MKEASKHKRSSKAFSSSSVMASVSKKKKVVAKKPLNAQKVTKIAEKKKIADLDLAARNFVPPNGLSAFADLPISDLTKRGLKKASFMRMTDIQTRSLPVTLSGKDVLGAARTGSGKTLAFLIPVLEMLYRKKWGSQDGLGALIISPTRELAVQIFDVLRSIGPYHSFSAGLVIGGKNLKDESERLSKMDILVATPGRLLQHLDQTVGFDTDNLQMLVLDEADRILDMGFSRTLTALLNHLPKSRQTLLFSATQTRSVADLARLSLNDPVQVDAAPEPTMGSSNPLVKGEQDPTLHMPKGLSQHYSVVPLPQKLSTLYSFLRTHLQSKTLVFLSSTKQVRHVYETFRRLQPGISLLHLHGKQKQAARLGTYERFAKVKEAVLFATDIAARGLDFARVDWVIQVDVPEDVQTYVHRVGRTARYESAGKALIFLCPSEEEGMVKRWKEKSVEVQKIKVSGKKVQDISNQLQNLAWKEPEIKYLAQRSFVSYLKSIHLHKDKEIFKLTEMPVREYAESLGLAGVPKIKFLSRERAKARGGARIAEEESDAEEISEGEDGDDVVGSDEVPSEEDEKAPSSSKQTNVVRTKYDRMFERKNQDVLSEHYNKLIVHDEDLVGRDDEGSDDDFIKLSRANHALSDDDDDAGDDDESKGPRASGSGLAKADAENISKRKLKLGQSKKAMIKYRDAPQHLKFDDDGVARDAYKIGTAEDFFKAGESGVREAERSHAEAERGKLKEADVQDREQARERRREKKRKRKDREREMQGDLEGPSAGVAALGGTASDDDGYVSPEFDLPSEDEDEHEEPRPNKKRKQGRSAKQPSAEEGSVPFEDDEELALRLLRQGR